LPVVTHADPTIVEPELPPPERTGRLQGEKQRDTDGTEFPSCLSLGSLCLCGESVPQGVPVRALVKASVGDRFSEGSGARRRPRGALARATALRLSFRPQPRRMRTHCLFARAVPASLRLAARSSPGWRGMRASARGWVWARAPEPSSPPQRGGGTTAPSPARRRSGPSAAAVAFNPPATGLPPGRALSSFLARPALASRRRSCASPLWRAPGLAGGAGKNDPQPKEETPARRGIPNGARSFSPLWPTRAEPTPSRPPGGRRAAADRWTLAFRALKNRFSRPSSAVGVPLKGCLRRSS